MSQAEFVWHELLTTDRPAAEAFYAHVVGWRMEDSTIGAGGYTLAMAGDRRCAGLMALPPEACAAGARPVWLGYIGVEDVDAKTAEVVAKGGAVHKPPHDIPAGRFSILADPTGSVFVIFRPSGVRSAQPRPTHGQVGTVGWHELYAGDGPAAFDWYAEVFGWARGEALDMGPMGAYQLFRIGGVDVGAIMTKPPQVQRPHWNFYMVVESVDDAAIRVQDGGGQVLMGPMDVPGGARVLQALDPQGAVFSLISYGPP